MRVLIVDLNNFAHYPSIAIGYVAAALRKSDTEVDVFSPLSIGSSGVTREPRTPVWGALDQQLRYSTAVSQNRLVQRARGHLAKRHLPALTRDSTTLTQSLAKKIETNDYDAVLVSTYLMYQDVCREIGALCLKEDIPFIVGGPYFAQPEVAREWITLPGLTALVGGEVETHIAEIVAAATRGDRCEGYPGVWSEAGGELSLDAPPLENLDDLAYPDFTDFPWDRYRTPIVPVITGRGCGWGRCTFCSDITSTAGRTFRSRSPEGVLDELEHQANRYGSKHFVFTDLKLNSNPEVWRTLIDRFPETVPDASWVASVHIGTGRDEGLSEEELRAARQAGMVRMTTGLESGSQRVLNLMHKGTRIERTERALRAAHAAGISVRVTMITGYPGETEEDVRETSAFIRRLSGVLDRVVLNRFQIITGSPFHRALEHQPKAGAGMTQLTYNHGQAQISHHYTQTERRAYRAAIHELIRVVHRINRRPLASPSRAFEGVM